MLIIKAKCRRNAAREIKTAMRGQYNAIGFIDETGQAELLIYGIKVLAFKELPDLVSKYKIEELIIAIPRAEKSVIKKIAALSLPARRMKVIPGINDRSTGGLM